MVLKHRFVVIGLLLVVILSTISVSVFVLESNTQANKQPQFQSKVTPFNFTTRLSWGPYSYSSNLMDYATYNTTNGSTKGREIPFYATLLPLDYELNNITYSIKIIDFQDPSGKNSNITVKLSSRYIESMKMLSSSFNGALSTSGGDAALLNTMVNKSISGILHVYHDSSGLKEYMQANGSQNYFLYDCFSLQPASNNKNITWDYDLTVEISLSGFEDRPLFNYLRKSVNFNAWGPDMFIPLNISKNTDTLNTRQIFFGPMAQGMPGKNVGDQIFYLNNMSHITNDNINVNIDLHAKNPVTLKVIFTRYFTYTNDSYLAASRSIAYGPLENSKIGVKLNWEKTDNINITARPVSKNIESVPDGTPSGYYVNKSSLKIFNFIAVAVENYNSNDQWTNWVNMTINTDWKKTDNSIPANKAEMTIQTNNHTKNIEFNLALPKTPTSTTIANDFPFSFFLVAIIIITYARTRHFKK